MKKYILFSILLSLSTASKASIYIDSMKVIKTDDTTYFLALYGVVLPAGPCLIIDSTKNFSNDTINIWLCYEADGSQPLGCRKRDSVYLGNLSNSDYVIILDISIVSGINTTCTNPWKRDTFQLNYSTVGIGELDFSSGMNLYPNPSTNTLRITSERTIQKTEIYNLLGEQVLLQSIDAKNAELNIAALSKGIYLLKLKGSGWEKVKRVIKQ